MECHFEILNFIFSIGIVNVGWCLLSVLSSRSWLAQRKTLEKYLKWNFACTVEILFDSNLQWTCWMKWKWFIVGTVDYYQIQQLTLFSSFNMWLGGIHMCLYWVYFTKLWLPNWTLHFPSPHWCPGKVSLGRVSFSKFGKENKIVLIEARTSLQSILRYVFPFSNAYFLFVILNKLVLAYALHTSRYDISKSSKWGS